MPGENSASYPVDEINRVKRLHERGRDPAEFVISFTTLLARAVNSGRRLAGMERSRDVMNPTTQRRHGFKVEPLPLSSAVGYEHLYAEPHGQRLHDTYEERLRDNTLTPVPEQVAFRLDWPAYLSTLAERDRRLVDDLALNHRTQDLAQKYGLSPGRISQKRREFCEGWNRFCDAIA